MFLSIDPRGVARGWPISPGWGFHNRAISTMKVIEELISQVKKRVTIDWTLREVARAKIGSLAAAARLGGGPMLLMACLSRSAPSACRTCRKRRRKRCSSRRSCCVRSGCEGPLQNDAEPRMERMKRIFEKMSGSRYQRVSGQAQHRFSPMRCAPADWHGFF